MAERTTPVESLEDTAADTPAEGEEPEEEPAGADEPEEAPDQSPASGRIAQAEYTRATQLAANVRRELGLPKTATQAEVIAAIQSRSAAPAEVDDDDGEGLTERERELLERSRAAELRVQSSVYGDEFTTDAVSLINLARSTDDLEELMTSFAAFRDAHGGPLESGGGEEAEDDEDEAEDEGDAGIDTSEGDRAPRVEQPSGGRRESGVVGAIRGLFAEAAESARRSRS